MVTPMKLLLVEDDWSEFTEKPEWSCADDGCPCHYAPIIQSVSTMVMMGNYLTIIRRALSRGVF